jgi:hypothetical protein
MNIHQQIIQHLKKQQKKKKKKKKKKNKQKTIIPQSQSKRLTVAYFLDIPLAQCTVYHKIIVVENPSPNLDTPTIDQEE